MLLPRLGVLGVRAPSLTKAHLLFHVLSAEGLLGRIQIVACTKDPTIGRAIATTDASGFDVVVLEKRLRRAAHARLRHEAALGAVALVHLAPVDFGEVRDQVRGRFAPSGVGDDRAGR